MRNLRKLLFIFTFPLCAFLFSGCMEWEYSVADESLTLPGSGLFVLNEGNFQYGNATLSYYNPDTELIENNVFSRANGMKLGDVAQSMTIGNDLGWIVVNNSHVIFAIDLNTGREKGRIENLTSPRFMHFVSPDKAYVSQLWDNRITIVNPKTYSISGYIDVPGMTMQTGSTEQMVSYGKYVFCNCWSYQNRIIRINTETDQIDSEITVGIQPVSIQIDCNNKLWVLCDGGYEGSPYGYEVPSLFRIDAETLNIENRWNLTKGEEASELAMNGSRDKIYWLTDDVWSMSVTDDFLPAFPLIASRGTRYYGLTVSPYNGDIYVADAVDYQQLGMVFRFSATGSLIDEFYAGITPGAYCWK